MRPNLDIGLADIYTHVNAGQLCQGSDLCQHLLGFWPNHAELLHLMGVISYSLGNAHQAIFCLRKATANSVAPALYHSNLAEICRQQHLLSEGEKAGRRAVELDPCLTAAWNNLGIILQETGKNDESILCLERVVTQQPDNPEGHNNLGNSLKRSGRLIEAEAHYHKALNLRPDYAEAYNNLSNLLIDLGQLDQAQTAAEQALRLNSRMADAYINRAAIETARSRHDDALRWFDALGKVDPNYGKGLAAKALTLRQLNRLEDAEATARHAIKVNPESGEAFNTLGVILQSSGRFDEALACYDLVATFTGLDVENALVNRAVLLMETARKDDAKQGFDQAIAAFPRSSQAWFNRSDVKTFVPNDPDIDKMEALLSDNNVQSLSGRICMHFALGKAYLDGGASDQAFRHLKMGNQLKRSTVSYNDKAIGEWVGHIIKTFSPTLFNSFKGVGDPTTVPVFVLGMPRSGTTLVEQILASHPEVHGAGELSILPDMVKWLDNYPSVIPSLGAADFLRMGQEYIRRTALLTEGHRYMVDKMPANFLYSGLIHLILPNAKIIHCRRDPVDTCLSCYTKLFTAEQVFTYDLEELGQFYLKYQSLMAHWRETLPASQFIEVDYESVVDNVEEEARRLIDFLKLPWDESCVHFHQNRRAVKTASVNQVRQPIYKTSKGRWKSYASYLKPLLDVLGVEG